MNWLDDISKRAEAATPGPWDAPYGERDHTWPGLYPLELKTENNFPLTYGMDGEEGIYADNKNDFDFIAHSRTDIPKLIEALRLAFDALEYPAGCVDCVKCENCRKKRIENLTQIAELGAKENK